MARIDYDLVRRGNKTLGLLMSDCRFETSIIGCCADINEDGSQCALLGDGSLVVFAGFLWDWGSGPAIDTPSVVRASLAHDALCRMTDTGRLPWKYRAIADQTYRDLLQQYGCPWFRRWYQWAGVRAYSKSVAYWKRTK